MTEKWAYFLKHAEETEEKDLENIIKQYPHPYRPENYNKSQIIRV